MALDHTQHLTNPYPAGPSTRTTSKGGAPAG